MSVDTRNKRASCLGLSWPPGAVWPNPDGSLAAQADRQQAAYAYPGIAASAPPVVVLSGVQVQRVPLLLRSATVGTRLRSMNVPGRNRTANVEF